MTLSKDAIESMGFKEHSSDEILEAAFSLVRVYSVKGLVLDDLPVNKPIKFGEKCTAILGNSVNTLSNLLFNDDFIEDEDKWQKEVKANAPFLILYFGPTKLFQINGGHRKEKQEFILTYDSFPDAKKELKNLEDEFLASVMTAIFTKFSNLPNPINFALITREVFAKTTKGKTLHDVWFQTVITCHTSTKIDTEEASARMIETIR
jgi:hypothetical protein